VDDPCDIALRVLTGCSLAPRSVLFVIAVSRRRSRPEVRRAALSLLDTV
jgi:hypothetical protein